METHAAAASEGIAMVTARAPIAAGASSGFFLPPWSAPAVVAAAGASTIPTARPAGGELDA